MYRAHHHIALFSLAMLAMMLLAGACYTAFWLPVRVADMLAERWRTSDPSEYRPRPKRR